MLIFWEFFGFILFGMILCVGSICEVYVVFGLELGVGFKVVKMVFRDVVKCLYFDIMMLLLDMLLELVDIVVVICLIEVNCFVCFEIEILVVDVCKGVFCVLKLGDKLVIVWIFVGIENGV